MALETRRVVDSFEFQLVVRFPPDTNGITRSERFREPRNFGHDSLAIGQPRFDMHAISRKGRLHHRRRPGSLVLPLSLPRDARDFRPYADVTDPIHRTEERRHESALRTQVYFFRRAHLLQL